MKLLPLSTDDGCDAESEHEPFDTILPLDDGANAANRCDIHDNRNRKNMVPFLKSNYKYKRRVPPPQLNYSVTQPKQVEVKRLWRQTPPPSDSPFGVVAAGLIVGALVAFRDILCKNSNKIIHRRRLNSEMSSEVKKFAWGGAGTWRYDSAAGTWRKTFNLEFVRPSWKLFCLTLFIALWMTAYEVDAGTCWMERKDTGKCEAFYAKNITKAQCCGKNQMFSYTETNLSDVEQFFALALGGGTECVPCLESCKDVACGPNKRCVKRKGRPKCICAPQCGSGKKHKKPRKRKQHIHQQNGSLKSPHVIDVSRNKDRVSLVNFHSPITVRDVRSLSSEIHSNPSAVSAMVLTSPGDAQISQSNSRRKNQRIPISTDPTKKQVSPPAMAPQHRLHHHHHHSKKQLIKDQQQQQQHHIINTSNRRRHAERNKGDKLIVTADDFVLRPSTDRDNDLADSNSLRDNSADTHSRQQHGRHHIKKHKMPRQHHTGAGNNSVYNETATTKITERRGHRTQSFDRFTTAFGSSAGIQGFKQQRPTTTMVHSSTRKNSNSNSHTTELLHPGQDAADDLTLEDKIHNGFFSNGFPYPHQELSTDEGRYTRPVCGSDGRTYNTECQLKKRACRTDNTALVVAYRGHCQTSCKKVNCLNSLQCVEDHYAIPHCILCSIECPIDDATPKLDPARAVCGVDGNTYKSTCDINRMVCKIGRSIAVAYPGPCREDRTSCSTVSCGPRMTCLTDLMTHRPRCVACKFKCARKHRPTSIRYEEGKLCGTNNRTYFSWCEMKKDSCQTGFFIDIKSIGECQQQGRM